MFFVAQAPAGPDHGPDPDQYILVTITGCTIDSNRFSVYYRDEIVLTFISGAV